MGQYSAPIRQQMATDSSTVSRVTIAVIFLPPKLANPSLKYVSNPCHLTPFLMLNALPSEAASISGKAEAYLTAFHCLLCMCNRMVHCFFVNCLIYQIFIDVLNMPKRFIPDVPNHKLHCFLHEGQ
jgi:hypothetical protein